MHDLVDFVSKEAADAGISAANYVKAGIQKQTNRIKLTATQGVRYTVPSLIGIENMKEKQLVRFRVGKVFKNVFVSAYIGEERVLKKPRSIMAPGEMEEISFDKKLLLKYPNCDEIVIKVEESYETG